jgi:hypothetical protein
MSTEPKPSKSISLQSQFHKAASPIRAPKVPEAIKKSAPKQSLEMPGPLGQKIRGQAFNSQLDKDRTTAKSAQIKNFRDKQRSSSVISKEKGQTQSKPTPTKDFNKSHGSKLRNDFDKAKGKDLGR